MLSYKENTVIAEEEGERDLDWENITAINDAIAIRWWVMEDFTGCRGNIHFSYIDKRILDKCSADSERVEIIDELIQDEFENRISYKWKIEK